MSKKVKLALIDAHALIHRAYHALPPMHTKDGQPTNAVYGFTTMLLKMFSSLKPTHVVAAFDMKGPTFRHKKFKEYKAHRKPVDADLVAQFDVVREVVRAFGIPIVEKQGYEADDIIGTLVAHISGDVKKIIVTGDKDTLQLVDDNTSVFTLKRGVTDTITYTPEIVQEEFGFGPGAIVDYKGLRGDPSDNIPGVKGVGDKTAKELLGTYGSIEAIYKHLEKLPNRVQSKLKDGKQDALLSKDLATIKQDVPITFDLDSARVDTYQGEKLLELLTRLEFRSLLRRLPANAAGQPTLFAAAAAALPSVGSKVADAKLDTLPSHYHLVESEADKKKLREHIVQSKLIAFDTENDRLGARTYPIVGMSFALRQGKKLSAYYIPVTPASVADWQDILENPDIKKVGHNLKYDFEVLRQSDITLRGIVFDSMIAGYLLRPGSRQYGLDDMALEELGYRGIPITDLIGVNKNQKLMSQVPLPDIARYACEDAEVTYLLYDKLKPRIEEEGLKRVLEDIELPLIPVLAAIELNGVAIDVPALALLNKKVVRRVGELQKKIWDAAGPAAGGASEKFNINSTQKLRVLLYEKLKLPTVGIKRTQSGYSTAAPELAKLRGQHKIIALLEEYRELTKLQNTYIETLPQLVDKTTGRIYAQFNQVIAATGRLSSQDPNLQNIPARTELGQEIRAAFVAPRGRRLVKADYSQLELRIVAHLSQDEKLLDVFRAGQDIHRATAAWVFGVKPGDVTDQQRREAKTLNFGVLYGMGPQAFAATAGISVEEARSFIGRYRQQYPKLMQFIDEVIAFAAERGYVETFFGRKRYIPEIKSNTPVVRAAAERAAFNFPAQGTESDILKKAMIALQAEIVKNFPKTKMILTVHDELVCEVDKQDTEPFAHAMKKIMEGVVTLDVPLTVDVAVGTNWRDVLSQ